MCFGGSQPAAQQAPAPPPPPPMDSPASPAFNEDTTNASNANAGVRTSRKGTRALRVDLGTSTSTSSSAGSVPAVNGLSIPGL